MIMLRLIIAARFTQLVIVSLIELISGRRERLKVVLVVVIVVVMVMMVMVVV